MTDRGLEVLGAAIASRRALAGVYQLRGFQRAWTPKMSDELLHAVRESAGDGLEPEDYLLSSLERGKAEVAALAAPLELQIDYDVLQTESLIRLLYHVIFGKVDPRSFDPHWNFTRDVGDRDPAELVSSLLASGDVYAAIEAQKPQYQMYRDLRRALARERDSLTHVEDPIVADGPKLEVGATGPRVAALRARLRSSGDLAAGAATADDAPFDAALGAAVAAFQARNGLDADGVVGPATRQALDAPATERIAQIRINLERGRWYLRDLEPSFVVVNVAGFQVFYLRDRQLVWTARAIVGKPYRKTPIFRSRITYLVFNPDWTVPSGILANDVIPGQRRDPSYLSRKGLELIDRSGRVVSPESVDWAAASARGFPYRVVQAPGPDNALGRVKFMFPNSYAVYLHDTPSRNLFERSERTFSSGCIRVEDPLALAAQLLEGQPGWDRSAIDAAVASGKSRTVTLAHPVTVLLTYWTAWVDREGRLQLRPDVYGRNEQVLRGLDAPFRFRTDAPRASGVSTSPG